MKIKLAFILFNFLFKYLDGNLVTSDCDCEPIHDYDFSTSIRLLRFQVTLYIVSYIDTKSTPDHLCTAIVLNRQYVLTVAECFDNYNTTNSFVVIGIDSSYGLDFEFNHPKNYKAYDIKIHPNYVKKTDNYPDQDQFLYNFALIQLTRPFENDVYLKKIKPACITNEIFYVEKVFDRFMSVSWGNEEKFNPDGTQLHERDNKTFNCYQKVIDYAMDKLYYTNEKHYKFLSNFCFNNSFVCANTKEYYTCSRDIGIPLFAINDKRVFAVGLYTRNPILAIKGKKINRVPYCFPVLTNFFVKLEHALNWLRPTVGNSFLCEISSIVSNNLKTKNIPRLLKYKTFGDGCNCRNEIIEEFFDEYYVSNEKRSDNLFQGNQKKLVPPKGKFDFVVQIVKHDPKDSSDSYRFYCTGVIINAYHVLTTASCANKSEIYYLYIYYGHKELNEIDNPYVEFFPHSKKVYDSFIHPYYTGYKNDLIYDLQILKVKSSLRHTSRRLKPACFANENEVAKQDGDKLILTSFEIRGNFETIILDEKFKSNLNLLLYKYKTNVSLNDLVESCETQICFYTNKKISLGNEGTPLLRLTKDFIEVVGLLKQDNIDYVQKIHRFVAIPTKMKWIKSKVGEYNFCERDISNRIYDKKICECDHKIGSEKEFYPFVASIITYDPTNIKNSLANCKALVLNEYWVLTTYNCVNNVSPFKGLYVYLNFSMPYSDENVNRLNLLGKLYHYDYYLQEENRNLTLLKTIEKMNLGEDYKRYASCLHKLGKKIKLKNRILLMDTEKNKQEIEITNKCYNCIKVKKEICKNYEGNPIFQTQIRNSIAVGLLSVKDYMKTDCQKKGDFAIIYIQDNIDWIVNKIGEESYCKYEEYYFDPKICTCSLLNDVEIFKKDRPYDPICHGIFINHFQVLTTASCVFENDLFKQMANVALQGTKIQRNIHSIEVHPKNFPLSSDVYKIEKANYNFAILKIDDPELKDEIYLSPACFTNRKEFNNFFGYQTVVKSLNNSVIDWVSATFETINSFPNISCGKVNYVCMNATGLFCDSDQGLPIRKKTEIGYKTFGLFSVTDERLLVDRIFDHGCYYPYIVIGLFLDIADPWFLDQTEAYGFCEFGKHKFQNTKNSCECYFRNNNIEDFYLLGNKTIPERLKSSFCYVMVGYFDEELENPFYLKFFSSCVLLNKNWALTLYAFDELKNKKIYIGTGSNFKMINHELVEYSDDFILVNGIEFIRSSFDMMLLRINFFNRFQNLIPPCITRYLSHFGLMELFYFGFGSQSILRIDSEDKSETEWHKVSTNYTYEEVKNNLNSHKIELDRNDYYRYWECVTIYICVKPNFKINKFDYGGPIYRFNGESFELIAILTKYDTVFYRNTFFYKFNSIQSYLDGIYEKVGEENLCKAANFAVGLE